MGWYFKKFGHKKEPWGRRHAAAHRASILAACWPAPAAASSCLGTLLEYLPPSRRHWHLPPSTAQGTAHRPACSTAPSTAPGTVLLAVLLATTGAEQSCSISSHARHTALHTVLLERWQPALAHARLVCCKAHFCRAHCTAASSAPTTAVLAKWCQCMSRALLGELDWRTIPRTAAACAAADGVGAGAGVLSGALRGEWRRPVTEPLSARGP
jgi:hypothetical protein